MTKETAPFLVRPADLASASDAAGILAVLDSYASDPVGGGTPLTAEVRNRLIPALREHPGALVLLALTGERPVGLLNGFFGLSTFQARPLLNIHDIAVVPDMRGQGIGRLMLTESEKIARQRGCCKLTLEVQDGNSPARLLYDRFGFRDVVYADTGITRFLAKRL
jgi:ribosomal protein S18 acetylase RimI-like enzyme